MAQIKGFRGLRYVREKVGPYDDVVTPPFDVISPAERRELAARSPYNLVHLILPEPRDGLDKYQAAAAAFESWLQKGVMAHDSEESYYLLEQRFTGLDGVERTRRAFFAVVRIPEEGENTILGHERTFAFKVTDRLNLMRATHCQPGAVFGLYDDPRGALAAFLDQMSERPEDLAAQTIDGVRQRLWRVPADPGVAAFFADKQLYIADGHHRFRTAAEYRNEMRAKYPDRKSAAYYHVLMGLVALQDPGLVVYPAHRVLDKPAGFDADRFLRALQPWFEVEAVGGDLLAAVEGYAGCAIGAAIGGKGDYLLKLRAIDRAQLLGDAHGPAWRELDVSVLHGGILERVLGLPQDAEFVYEIDVKKALELTRSGQKGLTFVLDKFNPAQICACAAAGEYMPQKATYFFPKLPSGAVIHHWGAGEARLSG